jgi:hypothetical protein
VSCAWCKDSNTCYLIRDISLINGLSPTWLTSALRFLWVVLQLDYLCSLETDLQISKALERMPMSLTETYSRIIEEINRKDPYQRSLAIACFRWILSATRELRWIELVSALTLADPCPVESYRACSDPSIDFVSSACGNLVHIPKKKMTWWGDEKITFIHSSVFQFFSDNFATLGYTGDPWKVLHDTNAMHLKNALDCIGYLCLVIEEGLDLRKDFGREIEDNAFAYYSIHNFDKHLLASSEASHPSSTALDLVRQLLNREEAFLDTLLSMRLMLHSDIGLGMVVSKSPYYYVGPAVPEHILWTTQLHKIMSERVSQYSPGATLRLLARSGLLDATENLIRQGFFETEQNSIDEEDEHGCSALYRASEYGHPLLVELLIREGARPEPCPVRDESQVFFEGYTPLCVAISERMYGVAEVLLNAGVDANIPARVLGGIFYPIELAEFQGDHLMIRLLEKSGACRRGLQAGRAITATETSDTVGGAESK